MRYQKLGNTGLFVSELCLGTMTFGGEGGMWGKIGQLQQSEAEQLVGRALDAGINFIDTADVYSEGRAEEIVGQALKNLKIPREKGGCRHQSLWRNGDRWSELARQLALSHYQQREGDVEVMRTIAESKGVSVAQIALAWLLHQKAVTSVIIGAKRVDQLDDNIAATDVRLSEEERKQLDAVSALPREYPGWMLERQGEYRRGQLANQ
ncbi:aldo/keto reductase [unidentified bacterial endosymbiont]|uniref:aldo/keto reductase n=1 Tax=unidentified bacterial endosymbiont TaxID=2355 RepID=UPI002646689A|nr:aldo/keto reductase [unidentified bacterial endosymbiont]